VKHYVIMKAIGQGQYGQVFQALDTKSNEFVAIKVQPCKRLQGKLLELYSSEVNILKQVKNENVIKFIDDFELNRLQHLVMEHCDGGDMEEFLKQ